MNSFLADYEQSAADGAADQEVHLEPVEHEEPETVRGTLQEAGQGNGASGQSAATCTNLLPVPHQCGK